MNQFTLLVLLGVENVLVLFTCFSEAFTTFGTFSTSSLKLCFSFLHSICNLLHAECILLEMLFVSILHIKVALIIMPNSQHIIYNDFEFMRQF